jgi:hypothetical protein
VSEGHTPVVAVLVARVKKADELICAPKGIAPSAVPHFSCKATLSQGAEVGAMRADMDPQLRHPLAIAGDEGHARVVAILRTCEQSIATLRPTAPLGTRRSRLPNTPFGGWRRAIHQPMTREQNQPYKSPGVTPPARGWVNTPRAADKKGTSMSFFTVRDSGRCRVK